MSVLNKIAHFQNRRDEVPNQELAKQLVKTNDRKGIREIAENLWNKNPPVQSDCLKVLYEVGYLQPELIADYADDFLKLLQHVNNRLVWGAMIGLSTIAAIKADAIFQHASAIITATENGSVITADNGVKTLAIVAAQQENYGKKLFPHLLKCLETCRPKDVPQYAEKILVAVNDKNRKAFVEVLETRLIDLKQSQIARVKKVLKEVEKR